MAHEHISVVGDTHMVRILRTRRGLIFGLAVSAVLPLSQAVIAQSLSSADTFTEISKVLQHPRCLNCHPRSDRPNQGNADTQRLHQMNVQRGPEGKGAAAQQCSSCHGDKNNAASGVPGAPHWHLAPRSMGWAGLSVGDLCRTLLDRSKNGNRSPQDLIKHMAEDPLVRWGWEPGGKREAIPIAHPEFIKLVAYWVETGAACPK
jgi:hypothetical protein